MLNYGWSWDQPHNQQPIDATRELFFALFVRGEAEVTGYEPIPPVALFAFRRHGAHGQRAGRGGFTA